MSKLKTLKLVFAFSLFVSIVQICLYRSIVLNAKHAYAFRYPWKQESIELVNDEFSEEKPKTCNYHGELSQYYQLAKEPSDLSDWSFSNSLICPNLSIEQRQNKRLKIRLVCNKEEVLATFVQTNSTDDVYQIHPDDRCLGRFVGQCCTDALPVPNVVHYIWYDKKELSFFEFVSFISTIRFVRPCAILIHGDRLPEGGYWDFIVSLYPNIVHVVREVPTSLFGKNVKYNEHIADAWKIRSLLKFGGIYMDTDMLLVKSIDPLRRYPYTMSRQSANMPVSSAFIMAERNTSFIQEWLHWYQIHYVNESYTYNSMYSNLLSGRRPEYIHIEYGTVSRPSGKGNAIFTTNTDWSNIFGMHLNATSYNRNAKYVDENNVRRFNTTVGAMCRHILFGNKELCT